MNKVFSVLIGSLLLSGCGSSASQMPSASQAFPASASQRGGVPLRAGSWMLPEAAKDDLLYVSNCCWVSVYSYPKGEQVGKLTGFYLANGQCVDSAGDIYITDDGESQVYRYAHGSKVRNRTYSVLGAIDCSIDPTTGDLAVASWAGYGVLIFRHATGKPIAYKNTSFLGYYSCGYDSKGNLFVDGATGFGSGKVIFAELSKGGSHLKTVTLPQYLAFPGGVKWDGEHVAVADGTVPAIYQFVIAKGKATKVGTTPLGSGEWTTHQFWIQGQTALTATECKSRCIGGPGNQAVMFFKYPTGGTATKLVTKGLRSPTGVSVSLAPKR